MPPVKSPALRLVTVCFAAVIALYAAVVILKPDVFLADDSYFYFQVAWNFAHGMGSTFNGLMNTNGYHPVWMLVCALVFKLITAKTAAIRGIAAALCFFDILTLVLVKRILDKTADNTWWMAYILLVPFSFLSQLGTEGALSCCLLAGLALAAYSLVAAPSLKQALVFNLVAALAVLARLDNIFIVTFIWIAVLLGAASTLRAQILRLQLLCLPIYLVLWGGYLASNLYFFGILQPISGMVKSHPTLHVRLGSNLPHTALYALAVIGPCILVMAWKQRDTFFRVVELPFTLGVFCHAYYIVFRMSDETRWSWYYTSWILLASLLLARATSLVLPLLASALSRSRAALATSLAWACLLLVAAVWVKVSFLHFYRLPGTGQPLYFEQVVESNAMHTAFAFDKPGQIAYYTDLRIITLDDLMGNMTFQKELVAQGVNGYAAHEGVDSFIGPPVPLDSGGYRNFCEKLYLDSVVFHCNQTGANSWTPISVDVYSRLPHTFAGTLLLSPPQLLWTKTGDVSFWRIVPTQSAP